MNTQKMKFLILILVFCLWKGYVGQNLELLEDCIEKFDLQYCSVTADSNNTLWNLYSVLDNHFTVLSSVPCIGLGYKFQWILKQFGSEEIVNDFKKYRSRSILFIEANSIPAGEYSLELTISHKNTAKIKSFKCMVRLQSAPIFAAIDGAQIRGAHSGDTVELDGSYSYTGGNIGVKYSWVGFIETPEGKEKRKKENELTAQGERARFILTGDVGQVWKFILTVTSEKYTSKAEVKIKIQSPTTPIIDIIRSCPAAGHHQFSSALTLSLGVVCHKRCEAIEVFEWNVPDVKVIDIFGPKDAKLTVRFRKVDKKILEIEVVALGSSGQDLAVAVFSFPFFKATYTTECTFDSETGIGLLSVIRVKCEPMSDIFSYKILQLEMTSGDYFELPLSKNSIPEFAVRLSSFARMVPIFTVDNIQNDLIYAQPIYVTITNELPSQYNNTMEIVLDMYSNKVLPSSFCQNPTRLGNEGRVWEAIQVITALMPKLIAEETDKVRREFNTKLSTRILQDMLNFPTETVLDSLIIALTALMRPYDEPKVLKNALALSNICKHLAVKRKEDLKTKNALLYEDAVLSEHKILKNCANYLMSSNYHKSDGKDVTTLPPLEDHPVIAEDYPFYGDLITDTMREDFSKITNNTIEIAQSSSIIRVLSWTYGEEMLLDENQYFQADSVRMIHREIIMDRCVINLPHDIGFDDEEKVRIVVNIFNETLLFWENSDIIIQTVLIDLQILDKDGNEIHKLPELADISFNASRPFNTSYAKANVTLPLGDTSFNDTNIAIFKIDMKHSSSFQVVLKNVSEPLRVIAIHGKRPLISDFADSELISNDSHVNIPPVDYDTWLYIAVLPAVATRALTRKSFPIAVTFRNQNSSGFKLTRKTETSFDINIISQECMERKNNEWYKSACKIRGDSTSSLIHCQCYSISNIAGCSTVPNWKRSDLIVLSIVLEYFPSYIPMILTVSVFALYCVAATFAIFRRGSKQQIYYLGDNLSTDNYAYLIKVKTNKKSDSGTTANVVIKVYGQDSQSRAHVLNYPDPDKNLLQCGSKDHFILTTRQHLGELKKIELWTDCLQLRPTWKCDYVKVCDLQKRKWYLFHVENLFSLLDKCKYYTVVETKEIEDKRRRRITLRRIVAAFYWRFGAQHTWNIFSRKDDESFSYMERISIILSVITSTYAAAMLICVFPAFKASDAIFSHMGKLEVGKFAIIISTISFTINTNFVFMFRNLTKRQEYKFVYRKKILPEKIKYIIWTLLCLVISFSIVYMLFMGSGISSSGVYVWLAVTTIALMIHIFILEMLYMCILEIIQMTTTSETVYNYDNIVNESQYQKVYLKQVVPGYNSLRPYLVHLYKPMDAERYRRKRAQMVQRYKISKTFRDFIAFIIYFLLLYFLVNSNLDSHQVILNEHITEMVEGQLNGTTLNDTNNVDQLVRYLNETFVLSLHASTWYGNYSTNDPGLMMDFQTKLLGVARIRQKKVIATKCPARKFCAEVFDFTKCIPYYSRTVEDRRQLSEKESLWRHNSRLESGSTYFFGEFETYYGGGYTTHTGRTLENAFYNIRELSEQKWFDKYTRAVFIEFWAYNANKNLFTLATVAFEVSPTGYMEKSYNIHSLSLMVADLKRDLLIVAVFSVYCLVVFYRFGNIISRIINVGVAFWANAANYFDVGLSLTNFAVVGLYVHKQLVIENILDQLSRSKKNEFTKFFLAGYYSDIVTIVVAVLMCISVMGTWRFLRFGYTFKVFERAINTQVVPLLSAFTYSLVIYCQYVIMTYLLFGSYVREFRTVFNTITVVSLLGASQLKHYYHDDLANLLPVVSMVFYASYRILLLAVMKVYIAIITLHYEDSKKYVLSQEREFSIMSYVIEEFKYFVAYVKRKKFILKGGMDNINTPSNDIKVYNDEPPKVTKKFADEDQSSGVIYSSSNKLDFIPLVLFASLYNMMFRYNKHILTDQDYKLMKSLVWYNKNLNDGVKLVYYKMQLDERRSHFILKEDLSEMANIVNKLFEPEPKVKPERVKKHDEIEKPYSDTVSLKKLTTIANKLELMDRVVQNISVKTAHESQIQNVDSI